MSPILRPDLLLIGGGIAGLVCLDRLVAAGFDAVLVERTALGHGQTAHTQGILHSGLKYLLHGPVAGSFHSLVDRWRGYLEVGEEMDLRSCRVLSDEVLAWSLGPWSPDLKARFAEDGRPRLLASPPELLDGEVFAFPEPVIDVFSLLAILRDRHRKRLVLGEAEITEEGGTVRVKVGGHAFAPRRLLLTAGVGNMALLQRLGIPLPMRRLPLHMVIARSPALPPLWAHGMGGQGPPALTVTSHGPGLWYLGGVLSEQGIERRPSEQIDAARATLRELLPALDLRDIRFTTRRVERAEPDRPASRRFDVQVEGEGPVWTAWPIKLVLAPLLADRVLERLRREGIEPSGGRETAPPWPVPDVAEAPWRA